MRATLLMPLLVLGATPVAAQTAAPARPPAPIQVPPQLTDPATADKLANAMQALSEAFLKLPAGEVEAALEGRKPTATEKRLTVRDLARRDDPNFDRNLRRQMAQSRPMIQQSMKAIAQALPTVMQSLQQAGQALERAAANMPDPTYPKR